MPLPLYGSGGRVLRISAAVCPTSCSSRRFSKPFVTPPTMLATSVRVRPCSAPGWPRSVGRVTVIVPSACSIFILAGTCCCRLPSGPLTITRPGSIDTDTPAGISIGCLPIRLNFVLSLLVFHPKKIVRFSSALPDEAHDFAADSLLFGRAGRDQTRRRGQNRDTHPAEHARQTVLDSVDTAAGLGHPLEVGDDPLAAPAVLQLDDQGIEALALLHVEVRDVALLLEDAGDALLETGGRHLGMLVQRLVGVADPGEHVGYWVGQHLVTSSIWSCPESRPGAPGPAGRSGRGRTCGRQRVGARSDCSGSRPVRGTSAGAAA